MRKAVFVILAALLLIIGAVEFGFSGAEEKEVEGPGKMVCTYAQMANDFFLTFDKGAHEAVEALGNVYVAATDEMWKTASILRR